MTHRNARLTPVTRAELVGQVMDGWPRAEVARLFRVSRATVSKWVQRFRAGGPDALQDRSSRPLRSPRKTAQLQEATICAARRMLAWGPHRIGWKLGIARSTVYAVLRRAGLHRLAWLHRTTREVVRYEHPRPGIMVERVLTDNGACYVSRVFTSTASVNGVRLKRTQPFRPQTNGKAEAFNKILQAEWAYQRPYTSNRERLDTLPAFLAYYNHRRPHGGIGGTTPASRL